MSFITSEILSEGGITGNTFFGDGSNLTNVPSQFNGGTVTGGTNFTGGLSANTISATTITGTTLYGDGSNLTNVPSQFNGGTVTGATNFTGGLSANTISATTITGTTLYGDGSNLTGISASPSGTTGEVQFNNGGVFGGAANVEINGGNLQLVGTSDPSSPLTNNLLLYSKDIGGRILPKWIGPSGVDTPFQPNLFFNQISVIGPGGGTTVGVLNCTVTNVGTVANPVIASTNLKTQTRRFTIQTANTANSMGSCRVANLECWRGNAAGLGGFFVVARFGLTTTVTGNRMFVGLVDTVAAPSNIDPLTSNTNGKIGMAINANTGNWSLVHNNAGTAPTVVALGTSFPVNTTSLLELVLFAKPNDTVVTYRVTNLSTSAQTSGTLSTNLPASTTFLARVIWITNNTTGQPIMDCSRLSLETDY